MPQKTGLHRRLKKRLHRKLRRETSMMLLVPGRMEWGHIHCNQGHGATLCKNARTEKHEIKAVVQVYRSLFCLSVLLDS
jgi:hypothetical protein